MNLHSYTKTKTRLRNCSTLFLALSAATLPAVADEWKASIVPASLNEDQTIFLASNQVQVLTLVLQADEEVTQRSNSHDLIAELDLPIGMKVLHSAGYYTFTEPTTQTQGDRTVTRYKVVVANSALMGAPDDRILSEGKNQAIFVSTPAVIPAGQEYIRINLQDGEKIQTFQWPLDLRTFAPAAQQLKRTTLGLWDYNYSRATTEESSTGLARSLKDSGVNFVQKADDPIYRGAMRSQGIVTGGYTHHDHFFDKAYPDYSPNGEATTNGFPDAYAIASLPEGTPIPGVDKLIAHAREGAGIATFDFEPRGSMGFSPAAIAAFRQRYNVSEEEFNTFREYIAANGLKTHQSEDPLISRLWRQWTEFRSEQTSNYVRRISQAVKAQAPDVRVLVTSTSSAGKDAPKTIALGTDNAAMAQYTDIIMPQIYGGYGSTGAKLVMQKTADWRRELDAQKARTQLWPLLLVRYSGAVVGNTPERLRQQIIGSLAQGADGIGLYYPANMDARYWEMLARTTEDIAKYEDFYQDGVRVDEQFALSYLPPSSVKMDAYPNYQETVYNSGWSFTAHQLGDKTLLTLINLEEANDLLFGVDIGSAGVLSSQNVEKSGDNQWLMRPRQVGFIMLERK